MIVVIDNYDSFTYNLVHYLAEAKPEVPFSIHRNDKITLEEISSLDPSHIVISPGPCTPNEAGISIACIQRFSGLVPLLGVCLGHQAIGQAFGGQVVRAKNVVHGKTTTIAHTGEGIFASLPQNFLATRYHSLVISPESIPPTLQVTAWSPDQEIMAVRHISDQFTIGLQFHPESILTSVGKRLLARFLQFSYNPL